MRGPAGEVFVDFGRALVGRDVGRRTVNSATIASCLVATPCIVTGAAAFFCGLADLSELVGVVVGCAAATGILRWVLSPELICARFGP